MVFPESCGGYFFAKLDLETQPHPQAPAAISTTVFPIAIDAVAAGDGTLYKCSIRLVCENWKSSTNAPDR
jgi:hypothetical protein